MNVNPVKIFSIIPDESVEPLIDQAEANAKSKLPKDQIFRGVVPHQERLIFSCSGSYDRISFWDFEGDLVHSFELPNNEEHACLGGCCDFNSQGDFLSVFRESRDVNSYQFSMWSKATPIEKIGLPNDATHRQKFDGYTGAGIYATARKEYVFLYLADGHGGGMDFLQPVVQDGQTVMRERFGGYCLFENFCCSPNGRTGMLTLRHPVELHEYSLPKLQLTGRKLIWLIEHDESWDNDYFVSFDYINDDLLAMSTEYGRLYVVDTKAMRLIGELETYGFPLQTDSQNPNIPLQSTLRSIRRYRDSHLLTRYAGESSDATAYLSVDAIVHAVKGR